MASPYGALQLPTFDTPHKVGLLWMSDQPDQRPLRDNTHHSQGTDYCAASGI